MKRRKTGEHMTGTGEDRRYGEKRLRDPEVWILAVVYNRRIAEIASLDAFTRFCERHSGSGLIIADNSTQEEIVRKNRDTAGALAGQDARMRIRYVNCGGNVGLSRAYNLALRDLRAQRENASNTSGCMREKPYIQNDGPALPADPENIWIMLADDDTFFSEQYLENVYRAAVRMCERPEICVMCGVVETDGGWISPRNRRTEAFPFSFLLKRPRPGIWRDLRPINSGMCLRLGAIEAIGGFDERLFLDQVDFLTMDRLGKKGMRLTAVLDGEIRQSFSAQANDPEKTRIRWEIFRKDFEMYCTLAGRSRLYRRGILLRRRAAIFLQRLLSP